MLLFPIPLAASPVFRSDSPWRGGLNEAVSAAKVLVCKVKSAAYPPLHAALIKISFAAEHPHLPPLFLLSLCP